jgi:hypothetical protein
MQQGGIKVNAFSCSHRHRISLLALLVLIASESSAGDLTGRIDVIAPVAQGVQAQVYLRMKDTPGGALPSGLPGASCSTQFAVAEMGDTNFKNFIYPLILMAKATDALITLRTNGCNGIYPMIIGIDYSPR